MPLDQEASAVAGATAFANTSDEERRERRRRRRREREERRNREEKEERDKVEIQAARKMEHEEAVAAASLLPKDDSLREQGHYDRPPGEEGYRLINLLGLRSRSVPRTVSDPCRTPKTLIRVSLPAMRKDDRQPGLSLQQRTRRNQSSRSRAFYAPRERFPEDPAPIREGVAPLKDAGKSGIPQMRAGRRSIVGW